MSDESPGSLPEVLEEQFLDAVDGATRPSEGNPIARALAEKATAKHLEKALEIVAQREQNRHAKVVERTRHRPRLLLVVAGLVLLFVMGFGWMALAYGKSEVILPVITGLSGLLAGALGGYGYARADTPKSSDKNLPAG